jgi:hypothetical protein
MAPTEEEMDEMDQQQKDFVDLVNNLGAAFDELCVTRHEMGQEEYGQFTFLGNDVVRMMLEELADTANYCRYQAVKLMLLQQALELQLAESPLTEEGQQQITVGIQAFKGTKDVGWHGFKS